MHCIAWVYILTNARKTVLYVGATNDLPTRLWEHQTRRKRTSFTARYNVFVLVHYEGFETVAEAFAREKFIKGKTRQWKVDLIKSKNPDWRDLTMEIMGMR